MLVFRLIFGLLAVASVLCFAMYIGTREAAWRHRGIVIIKWTVIAGLVFFAVLMLETITAPS